MTAPFDNIVQHLFHQPSLQSVTVDELERMAKQHPSFAAAQFLLLKKMQETTHPNFSTQLHKTTLYFNNPLWLQFLLQQEKEEISAVVAEEHIIFHKEEEHAPYIELEMAQPKQPTEEPITVVPQEIIYEPINTIEFAEDYNHSPVVEEETTTVEENKEDAAELITEQIVDEIINPVTLAEEYNHTPAFAEEKLPGEQIAENIIPVEKHISAIEIAEQYNYNNVEAEIPVINAEPTTSPLIDEPAQQEIKIITETPQENNYNNNIEIDTHNIELTTAPLIEEPIHETISEIPQENTYSNDAEPETAIENNAEKINAPVTEEYVQHVSSTEIEQEYTEHDAVDADNTGELNTESITETHREEKPLLKTIIETTAAKEDLLFEPYHTIDYFASQGIKLSKIEPEPQDKFGKQLKSFTEWLKSMKKLPQVSADKVLGENEELQVVAAANHSIENKEVITETMAEVLEKQGLHEKAAEVYRKLSLLNPRKSAYFAGRIEALKQ